MTTSPTQPQPDYSPVPIDNNASNLSTLSIFYFIIAGLQALVGCFFFIYIAFGVIFALIGISSSKPNDPSPALAGVGVGGIVICFGLFLMAFIGTLAYLNYLAGKSLRERKRLTLCYVMAATACLNIPLGTILGVFTFIVLSKPGVKESFH